MEIAYTVSRRATCPRAQMGVVAVGRGGRILATGYNGAPSRSPHCFEVGCLIESNHCIRAVHAEMNLLVQSAIHGISLKGSVLVVNAFPCRRCLITLLGIDIPLIVYDRRYGEGISETIKEFERMITIWDYTTARSDERFENFMRSFR